MSACDGRELSGLLPCCGSLLLFVAKHSFSAFVGTDLAPSTRFRDEAYLDVSVRSDVTVPASSRTAPRIPVCSIEPPFARAR